MTVVVSSVPHDLSIALCTVVVGLSFTTYIVVLTELPAPYGFLTHSMHSEFWHD
jgi:hypothetical protein